MRYCVALIFCCIQIASQAQKIEPGFNKQEYLMLLKLFIRYYPNTIKNFIAFDSSNGYKLLYSSPVIGLDNKYELWQNGNIAAVVIRGTTAKTISWMENFYAAQVAATGSMALDSNYTFNYKLANNNRAGVHIGWLIATGCIAQLLQPQLDSMFKNGVKNVYIFGHSQGGAIAYLLSAYLKYVQTDGKFPNDVLLKTYCSAAPKPGNLFFAYDFEQAMGLGWCYNIINPYDWVPETPISIQTLGDFNGTNPFKNAKKLLSKQPFPKDVVLKYAFNQLSNPPKRAVKKYERYLGNFAAKAVKKSLPYFVPPTYLKSINYVRTSNQVVLKPTEQYLKLYPESDDKIFIHHSPEAYAYLMQNY